MFHRKANRFPSGLTILDTANLASSSRWQVIQDDGFSDEIWRRVQATFQDHKASVFVALPGFPRLISKEGHENQCTRTIDPPDVHEPLGE